MVQLPKGDLYYQIQNKPLTISEKDIAGLLDRSRLDPRLMEVLTEFIRDFWWNLDSHILNKQCKKAINPFIIKAIVACITDFCEIDPAFRKEFFDWIGVVAGGIRDPNPQFLYIGVFPILSKTADREVKESLECFKRHNLFAKDLPFNKGKPGKVKSYLNPPEYKVTNVDYLKLKYINLIKSFKKDNNFSNEEVIKKTGINRVFLSKILNNKTESITTEYLENHAAFLYSANRNV